MERELAQAGARACGDGRWISRDRDAVRQRASEVTVFGVALSAEGRGGSCSRREELRAPTELRRMPEAEAPAVNFTA